MIVSTSNLYYLKGAILVLRMCYCYPLEDKTNIILKLLANCWYFFMTVSFIIINVQFTLKVIFAEISIMEGPFYAVEMMLNYFSLYCMVVTRLKLPTLQKLIKTMNEIFVFSTNNQMEVMTMEKDRNLADLVAYLWPTACVTAVLFKTTIALIHQPGRIPIDMRYPYDWERSPAFELTIIWLYITECSVAFIHAATDVCLPCITLLVAQQFRILASNIKNGFYTNMLNFGIDRNTVIQFRDNGEDTFNQNVEESIITLIQSEEFRLAQINTLKANIKHHIILLDYCEEMNAFFSILLLAKIISNFTYIILMFFSLLASNNTALLLESISYAAAGTVQLCVYTTSGEILSNGADILDDIYEYPWYWTDLNYRKLFVFLQMRTGKLVYASAGNYYKMSLQALLSYTKTVFSYVAVLKELTKDRN